MNAASLAGFAVVFVLVAWLVSAIGSLTISFAQQAARTRGPAAERRVVELAALAPLVLASAVVAILMVVSLVGPDHCLSHHHHAHLCLVHGAPWAGEPWVIALLALAGLVVAIRLVRVVVSVLRARRSLSELQSISAADGMLRWLPTPDPVCFVTRRGEVFVSTGTWDALDETERAAMLAHEHAHHAQRDIDRGLGLALVSAIAAPWCGLRARWHAATEELCDARAAEATGDREAVASALVKLARIGMFRGALFAGFGPTCSALTARVHAVLADRPVGDRAGSRIAIGVAVTACAALLALAAYAPLLHDVIEDVLG